MELFDSLWKLLIEFALLAVIVWGLRRANMASGRRLEQIASNWPIADGAVEHARPQMVGEGRSGYWVGELSYSYSVEGEYYAGVVQLPATSEETACQAVSGWKDRRVRVRYMPGEPSRSVLVVSEQIEKPTLA